MTNDDLLLVRLRPAQVTNWREEGKGIPIENRELFSTSYWLLVLGFCTGIQPAAFDRFAGM